MILTFDFLFDNKIVGLIIICIVYFLFFYLNYVLSLEIIYIDPLNPKCILSVGYFLSCKILFKS